MLQLRWQLSPEEEAEDAEIEEVAEIAEDEEPEVEEPLDHQTNPDSRGPSTLTFQMVTGRGARCISNGGGSLFSAVNPPPAHGRISTPQSPTNEPGTSLEILEK